MVNITIDGKQVSVPEGTTVLRAAENAGVVIPTLCDHKELAPYGGCRLCLVEVEGARTLQPSCTLPVTPNMVIHTATDKVKEARKFVLSLIFSERNHFCMFCQVSGGDCELQNSAYAEGMTHWPLQPNYTPFTVDASHPYFVIDNNRCILCRRCVRACGELIGNFTLGIEERGANSYLVADLGGPIGESTCVSCGTCVQVCPTGAIIDRQSAYNGREKDTTKVKTICTRCSIGCGMEVLTRDNRVVRIDGDWEASINHGLLCSIGRFEPLINDKERIPTALVAGTNGQKASTLDGAVKEAVSLIQTAEPAAALITDNASLEELSLFSQLFGGNSKVKTGVLGGNGFLQMEENVTFTSESSLSAVTNCDVVILIGADLAANHQVAGFMVKRQLPTGSKMIMLSDAKNGFSANADAVLDTSKGLELALKELIHGIKDESASPAKYLVNAKSVGIIVGETAGSGDFSVQSGLIKDLSETLVKSGKATYILSLKGGANGSALRQFGLNHSMDLNGVKTVILFQGEDTVDQKMIQKLNSIPNLVVIGSYNSNLAARAKVVIPASTWWETSGTYMNIEKKLQESQLITRSTDDIISMQDTLSIFGKHLGIELNADWQKRLISTTGRS